ncbi:MAG: flagellar filament capping protein FliD [Spirochaetes bacterium]|nr:flagellar filament capping protein FliD [Spirochaetota bacterium]
MSDMNIPGVSGTRGVDSQKMIDDLMKVERRPLDRMENEVDEYQTEKQVWQELSRTASSLSDQARSLYGFQNPFSERVATSSDQSVLTATAQRQAPESVNRLEVEQIAGADTFVSSSVPLDTRVPEGRYGFRVGEQERFFNFRGGDLGDFAEAVTRNVGELVEARVVKDSAQSEVITFRSQLTGAENRMQFLEQAQQTALDLGVLERSISGERTLAISQSEVAPWRGELSGETVSVRAGTMEVSPGGSVSLPVEPRMSVSENMVLELDVRVVDRSDEITEPPPPPEGPNVPDAGSVTLDGITIPYPQSDIEMPDYQPPEEPRIVTDSTFLFAREGGQDVALPALNAGEEFQTIQIPLAEHVDSISALNIRNENTHRDFYVQNARIFDPTARGEFEPRNPIETASDAQIKLDGITATRSSNTIDDLIPGATLELHGPSRGPVNLEVEPDRETIKDSVIGFVGQYNQLIRDINILTRSNESIIQEIGYFSDEEREQARERLGMMQGDSGLNQMRARLQQIMMNSYPTDAGQELNLLAQLGISTSAGGFNTGGVNTSRLRGYLEMDEAQFDAALQNDMGAVRQLFGSDTDGDLATDEGIAYRVQQYVRPFVQPGGIFQNRQNTLDSQISRTEDDMGDYADHLDRYEQRLRQQFGRMENAMNEMDANQRSLQRLNNNSGN